MSIKYLRAGNSGIYSPGNYRATSNGCFRNIVVRTYAGQPKPNIRERFTFDVGTMCENIVADMWRCQGKIVETDVEVSEPITEHVHIKGHIDAIVNGRVFEEKSIQSTNSFKKIYRGGIYKLENVVQLVQYLLIKEHTEGTLIYTVVGYYGESNKPELKSEPGLQREFQVNIKDDGKVIVNNQEEANFTIEEILGHREEAARLIKDKIISTEVPTTLDPPWSPCGGCWLAPYCETWEKNKDDTEFWKNVETHLDKTGRKC